MDAGEPKKPDVEAPHRADSAPVKAGSPAAPAAPVEDRAATEVTAPESQPVPRRRPAGAKGGDGVAEAVRSSGASRDALIGLCQDLETRLDLAERERQASTASLLMAQRRVLDLELKGRSAPWARAGGAALGLMSISALVIMAMLPGWLDDRAAGREASQSAQLTAELGRLEVSMGALATASGEERAALTERLDARTKALDEALGEAQRRAEERAAEAAAERARAEAASAARTDQLGELEERLVAADRQAVRRSAELEIIVEASARDRARFDERLAAAERDAAAARIALNEARARSLAEREAFERQLALSEQERAAQHTSRAAETEALRAEIRGLMNELQAGQAHAVAALEAAGAELRAQVEATAPLGVDGTAEAAGDLELPVPEEGLPRPLGEGGSWWIQLLRSVARG